MKIGFVTANLDIHGVATFTLNLSQWLQTAGHAVTVVTVTRGAWWPRLTELGIPGECIDQQPWESVTRHVKRLAAWLAAQAFDLLVVNVDSSDSRPLQLSLHLLPDRLPVMLILHNDQQAVYAVAKLNRAAWNYAVGVSPQVQKTAAAYFEKKNIDHIPYGIPHGVVLVERAETFTRPGWATPLRLLFVGRLDDQQKGIFRLPAIVAECQRRQLPVQLTVIGDGPDRRQLSDLFAELGVQACVVQCGSQPQSRVLEAMRTHHICLLPANDAGLPLVLLEAQAHGCVPIATHLPGITEHIVQEGVSGLLVRGDDVAGMVDGIATMVEPTRWCAFSAAGRKFVQQSFSLQQMGERYLQRCQALVQGDYPLPLPRSLLPSPFGWRDYLPQPVARSTANVPKRFALMRGGRWLRRQAQKGRALMAYGVGRKLRADWLGISTYLRYRRLARLPDFSSRKTILIMDNRVLRPQDSTLGRSNDLYNRLLQALGWRVLLMPYSSGWDGVDDGPYGAHWDEPYAVQLRQQGLVVLAGWFFRWRRQSWLRRNAAAIDYVLFRFPDAAEAYIPLFRAHSTAKLIFLAPDLNAVREQREYAATGKLAALKRAQRFAQREHALFQAADAVLTRSSEEHAWLAARYGSKVLRMPLFFYPTLPVIQPVPPASQIMLFVGSFAHRPNPDGIHWFVQSCLPLLLQQCPGAKLVLAGPFAKADIFALQAAQIEVLGRVSDEQLTTLYQQARVALAPLRFGAGVKGKVIEALAHGVPVVTTRFGVEGMPGLDEIINPTDTPVAMAAALAQLLTDDQAWRRMSAAGQHFVQEHFSVQAARATLVQLFAALEGTQAQAQIQRLHVASNE